jgi:hypothetical protein
LSRNGEVTLVFVELGHDVDDKKGNLSKLRNNFRFYGCFIRQEKFDNLSVDVLWAFHEIIVL